MLVVPFIYLLTREGGPRRRRLLAWWLGAIFLVYLVGTVLVPWVGWAIHRVGRRACMLGIVAAWMAGILLTLATPLPLIIAGLGSAPAPAC